MKRKPAGAGSNSGPAAPGPKSPIPRSAKEGSGGRETRGRAPPARPGPRSPVSARLAPGGSAGNTPERLPSLLPRRRRLPSHRDPAEKTPHFLVRREPVPGGRPGGSARTPAGPPLLRLRRERRAPGVRGVPARPSLSQPRCPGGRRCNRRRQRRCGRPGPRAEAVLPSGRHSRTRPPGAASGAAGSDPPQPDPRRLRAFAPGGEGGAGRGSDGALRSGARPPAPAAGAQCPAPREPARSGAAGQRGPERGSGARSRRLGAPPSRPRRRPHAGRARLTVEVARVGHHGGELFELVQGALHPLPLHRGPRHGETAEAAQRPTMPRGPRPGRRPIGSGAGNGRGPAPEGNHAPWCETPPPGQLGSGLGSRAPRSLW